MTATLAPSAPGAPESVVRPADANARGEWRVAARLARREVTRRWGRTLLVMLLVAVPVFGMTTLTVLVRTGRNTPHQIFSQAFGQANLVALGNARPPTTGWPAGTRILTGSEIDTIGLVTRDGTARLARVTDLDLSSPVMRGVVDLRSGRFPERAGEALLSPKLAQAFHVKVGDELHFTEPSWNERVVGIGVESSDWNEGLLAVRGNELAAPSLQFSFDPVQRVTLVELPGHPSTAQLQQYAPTYMNPSTQTNHETATAVDWTLVAGMIALAVVGVVISGAFAVGARRQLVTLGQLSANGASEPLLRRMLSLQGSFCGVLGTGLGIAGGVLTLALMHARFDQWLHRDIGAYQWSVRDLVAIVIVGVLAATLAAFFPARTAARVPVLSALAGRRPLGAIPGRVVSIGAALFAGGVFVLVLVGMASRNGGGNGLAFSAVVGGLLVLSGACCVSPVVVASLAGLGRHVRGAGRVAVRSIVRSRARSAAVVMALAAINAGAVAIGTAFASHTTGPSSAALMPANTLMIVHHAGDPGGPGGPGGPQPGYLPIDPSVERAMRAIAPNATWTERRAVPGIATPSPIGPRTQSADNGRAVKAIGIPDDFVVADPGILQIVGLSSSDLATLNRDGVLALPDVVDTGGRPPTSIQVDVPNGSGTRTITVPVAKHKVKATGRISVLITAAHARQLGLSIVDAGAILTNPSPFNESQRASIDALSSSIFGAPGSQGWNEVLWSGPRNSGISPDTVRQIILAIVVVIALIVLAMSLALSAAETRDERDVLVALGAPPRTMSGVAAWKAALLAFTGAALAVPTGFVPVAFVVYAAKRPGDELHVGLPWSTVAELVIVAPLIAAVIAAIGSSIAQRVRPTKMSTFATD